MNPLRQLLIDREKDKCKPCFAAGTPIRTPDGWRNIEEFRVGELVLSRDEFDASRPVHAKVVEEVFVNHGLVWHLHVGGRVIRTTAEHPFYVRNRGWVRCDGLEIGDRIATETGSWVSVEDLLDTGEWETLYNFHVADHHTYFIGVHEWGFSVWTHNACNRGRFILVHTMKSDLKRLITDMPNNAHTIGMAV